MQTIVNALTYCVGLVLSFFATFFNGIGYVLRTFLTRIFTLPPWVWKVFSFLSWACATVVAATITVLGLVATAIHHVIDIVGGVQSGSVGTTLPSVATDMFAVANTFTPVEEGFAMLTVLMTTYAAAVVVRTIKAWLPQIAGTGFSG